MIKVSIIKNYKSLKSLPQPFELPDFCILTGKNGSGKSHLMEAMTLSNISQVTIETGEQISNIKYIPFNGLNPKIDDKCNYLALTSQRKQEWEYINSIKKALISNLQRNSRLSIYQHLNNLHGYPDKSKKIFSNLLKKTNGKIDDITEEVFVDSFDISLIDSDDVLASSFAAIFKLYHTRMEDNNYHTYRNEKYGDGYPVLSDEEFIKKYGPCPWKLINKMMSDAHLPYQVNSPEMQSRDADFNLFLEDKINGVTIEVNDLSTGEKVLMSLALAIYNVSEKETKPDILLLDEPDASLHPEYSRVLINAIRESIVETAGVKTIISTHNPTTVALANDNEIYQMDKKLGYPIKISKEIALNLLTKDLDNLRVSVENRRQVFVESNNDVSYYEKIFKLLHKEFITYPVFLAPHNRDGSNCTDVINIVNKLRSLGNDLVYGLIDYDDKNVDSDHVYVLGGNQRYAIDNYIFDPIFVAFLLIRERIIKTTDSGIGSYSFSSLRDLSQTELQKLIDYIISELELTSENKITCKSQNDYEYQVTKEYLTFQGHELESKIMNKWPALNSIKRGKQQENVMKDFILNMIISEYPEFISVDFISTLDKIV